MNALSTERSHFSPSLDAKAKTVATSDFDAAALKLSRIPVSGQTYIIKDKEVCH